MRKADLYFLSGISFFGLITLGTPTLAQESQLATTSSMSGVTTEAAARRLTTQIVQVIPGTLEATATTSTLVAQAAPTTVLQAWTVTMPATQIQATSVSQLADVQPTDWVSLALQSLIERYGVIAGYPNNTYQGDQPLSRYEFAASLNAVLERVNELITTGANSVPHDDLLTLQRLEQEFAAELAALQSRVDSLSVRTAQLQSNQFSTTTKLTGLLVNGITGGGFSGERIVTSTGAEITDEQPNVTVIGRLSLDFNTSFVGTDLLKLRIDSGSEGITDNAAGFLEPTFGSVLDFSYRSAPTDQFAISRLNYTFIPFKDVSVSLGPVTSVIDYVDKNSYANLSALDFSTLALLNNYILFPVLGLGSGAAIDWNPGFGSVSVRAVYVAADADNPQSQGLIGNPQSFVSGVSPLIRLLYPDQGGNRGLFGDPYQGTIELEYTPSQAFALRLQYSGGSVFDGRFDVIGANVELALSQQLAVFGRYGYGSYDDTAFGDINPHYWSAGIALRDLFVPNATAGIAIGQPFIESAVGNATQTNFEAFYNFPVSSNIRVTPLVQIIANAGNQNDNDMIITGTLRTVFSF